MPKKAKKDNKKSKKVKKIPAKAGAKTRVSRDGKVEVVLPVDRSRGPYKKRKTEEQKIQERLNQLRSQERKDYSRQVLAPESVSGSYRRGGSIYRSDVSAPSGGFTGIVSAKEDRENKKLKEVNEKLDKLLAKEKKEKEEKEKKKPEREETEPKPAETELQQIQGEIVRSNIRRGIESRDRRQRQIQAEERAKREEEKKRIQQSRVRVATRELRKEKTAQEQSRVAEEERQQKIENNRKLKLRRQQGERDRRLDEREREERLRESSRELELISQKEKAEAHKRREQAETERAFSGARNLYKSKVEQEKTLQAERNIEKEKRELDRRQKALQDEKDRKDKEEAFKLQEKIDRERQAVKQKERQKLITEAHALKKQDEDIDDLFSELEKAPKENVEVEVKELEPEVETDDEEFVDVIDEEPDEPDKEDEQDKPASATLDVQAEARRKQILQDQEIARDLLRHDARKKDRKIKEEQERINKLSKLNETFIAHRNREDRNQRRRQQRQKEKQESEDREKLTKSVVDQALSSAILKQSQEEEERDTPPRSKRGRKAGKVTQQSLEALVEAGATRQEVEENDMRLQNIEVIIRGLFTGFGITLPREYRTASNKIRTQIRRDSIRKLRDRGFTVAQIQDFTRLLDELNELIRLRDKFGNRYQRRRGKVKKEVDRIDSIEESGD